MKLQINVSNSFGDYAEKITDFFRESLPEAERKSGPKSPNALIPIALYELGQRLGWTNYEMLAEAHDAMKRKPGPRKKDERQLKFDNKPGVWVSSIQLATGNSSIESATHRVSFFGLRTIPACASWAAENDWGAIPETQNDVAGLRLIPPGTPLVPEPVKPPRPNVTEVGVFISEAQVQAEPIAILADGRVVPRKAEDDRLGANVIRFAHAMIQPSEEDLPEETQQTLLKKHVENSFRIANADAVEIGWTVRRETRRGVRGFRYIPPGTKIRFVLPEQEVEMG